jgi:hypothetical protein
MHMIFKDKGLYQYSESGIYLDLMAPDKELQGI